MIINNTEIKNKREYLKYIRNNIIELVSDQNNDIEKYHKIKYNIIDKILFINTFKLYLNRKDTFILYVNSNNINENFNLIRLQQFIEYVKLNNKDRVSDKYLTLRYGYIKQEDRNNRSISLENYIKKFGIKIGTEKYNKNSNTQKIASKRSLNYWLKLFPDEVIAKQKLNEYQSNHIQKHLIDKSDEYINNYNKINSPWNIEFYIKKGYSIQDGTEIISNIKKDSSLFCIEHYLNRGYSLKEGKDQINKYWIQYCSQNLKQTSKQSLKQFKDILNYLFQYDDIMYIYYGDKDNNRKEYFLYDKKNKRYYFYDLTILYNDIKLIIEYNGHRFHPNKEKLSNSEWNNWKCLFNENINANYKYEYDLCKKQLALDNGFKYLTIWDNDNLIDNNNKIKQFIDNNLKIKTFN